VLSSRPGTLKRSFFLDLPQQFEVRLANLQRPWEELRSGPRKWRVSEKLLSAARLKKSGWFKDINGKRKRITGLDDIKKSLPKAQANRGTIEEMVVQARRLRPRTLLDLCSGGGWFIGRFLNDCRTTKNVIAIERDMGCLWTLEYKFRHVQSENRAEAIGGDARALPVRDGMFDVVTCANAFGEIAGISEMLSEAYRVLRHNGHLLISHSKKAIEIGALSLSQYRRLAIAADIYADERHLLKQAQKAGFTIEECVTTKPQGNTPCFTACLKKF